jgi:hypothetical protein
MKKLTEKQLKEIRGYFLANISNASISRICEISPQRVRLILLREFGKHEYDRIKKGMIKGSKSLTHYHKNKIYKAKTNERSLKRYYKLKEAQNERKD